MFCFLGSSSEGPVSQCTDLPQHSGWRYFCMKHVSDVLQCWLFFMLTWKSEGYGSSPDGASPRCWHQDMYDACIQYMLESSVLCQCGPAMFALLWLQAATYGSISYASCACHAASLLNNFRTLSGPYIFSLLFLVSMEFWIHIICVCCIMFPDTWLCLL